MAQSLGKPLMIFALVALLGAALPAASSVRADERGTQVKAGVEHGNGPKAAPGRSAPTQLLDRIVTCALRRPARRAVKPTSRASAP